MSEAKWKMAFATQKHNAKQRGIGWELTYEQWRAWWGDDIERRGTGPNSLQMQRFGDVGPYAFGNIKKGVPRENAKTAAIVKRNKACERAAKIRAQVSMEFVHQESGEKIRETLDEDERELHTMFYPKSSNFTFGI